MTASGGSQPPFVSPYKRGLSQYSFAAVLLIAGGLVVLFSGRYARREPVWHLGIEGLVGPVLSRDPVPCVGPRGRLLSDSPDDTLRPVKIEDSPRPYAGSYSDLKLDQTWLTADERYGPYGRGERSPGYSRSRVNWREVDWAELQNVCAERNGHRFAGEITPMDPSRRLAPPSWKNFAVSARPKTTSGRTAIVLRLWSTFEFGEEDAFSLRALITETALAYGGEYAVFVLLDVKPEHLRDDADLFSESGYYDELLDHLVPREFRNMTVLFHTEFLEQWYSNLHESRPEYQMYQPLQLFAHFFPGFDHYFQVEMDVRFTGHAGDILSSLSRFARNEPRKQARQRASYSFLPSVYNTYSNFSAMVNESLRGGDDFFTGVRIPDIPDPIGPRPKSANPQDDNFTFGVGEDADFFTFAPCNNVTLHWKTWLYSEWIFGFELGTDTPGRIICPVTVQRASWNLLNAIHAAQTGARGLRVQSESTLGSFALWHGMKLSLPPLPFYSRKDHRYASAAVDRYVNGGPPDAGHDGMAWGEWVYGGDGDAYRQHTGIEGGLDPTFRYASDYPDDLWRAWMQGVDNDYVRGHLPTIVYRDGEVYLPNTIMHPVKLHLPPAAADHSAARSHAESVYWVT